MKKIPKIKTRPIESCDNCGGTTRLEVIVAGNTSVVKCVCECEREEFEREENQRKIDNGIKRKQLRLAATFGRMEDVPLFHKCDSSTPDNVLNVAKQYVERFSKMLSSGQGLLLYGEPGQGKTFIAECIGHELCYQYDVLCQSAASVINFGSLDEIRGIDNDLFILDDLSSQRDTSYADERIFDLVNSRYSKRLPMIVTTNLTPQEMMQEPAGMKQRTYSRILERCLPAKVDCGRNRVQAGNYDQMKRNLGLL